MATTENLPLTAVESVDARKEGMKASPELKEALKPGKSIDRNNPAVAQLLGEVALKTITIKAEDKNQLSGTLNQRLATEIFGKNYPELSDDQKFLIVNIEAILTHADVNPSLTRVGDSFTFNFASGRFSVERSGTQAQEGELKVREAAAIKEKTRADLDATIAALEKDGLLVKALQQFREDPSFAGRVKYIQNNAGFNEKLNSYLANHAYDVAADGKGYKGTPEQNIAYLKAYLNLKRSGEATAAPVERPSYRAPVAVAPELEEEPAPNRVVEADPVVEAPKPVETPTETTDLLAAEHTRRAEEMNKLAGRGAWEGVDRGYKEMLTKCPDQMTPADFQMAADAAKNMGHVEEEQARLQLVAIKTRGTPAETVARTRLDEIEAQYDSVDITAKTLDVDTSAMADPIQRAAVAYAKEQLETTGDFKGYLPKNLEATKPVEAPTSSVPELSAEEAKAKFDAASVSYGQLRENDNSFKSAVIEKQLSLYQSDWMEKLTPTDRAEAFHQYAFCLDRATYLELLRQTGNTKDERMVLYPIRMTAVSLMNYKGDVEKIQTSLEEAQSAVSVALGEPTRPQARAQASRLLLADIQKELAVLKEYKDTKTVYANEFRTSVTPEASAMMEKMGVKIVNDSIYAASPDRFEHKAVFENVDKLEISENSGVLTIHEVDKDKREFTYKGTDAATLLESVLAPLPAPAATLPETGKALGIESGLVLTREDLAREADTIYNNVLRYPRDFVAAFNNPLLKVTYNRPVMDRDGTITQTLEISADNRIYSIPLSSGPVDIAKVDAYVAAQEKAGNPMSRDVVIARMQWAAYESQLHAALDAKKPELEQAPRISFEDDESKPPQQVQFEREIPNLERQSVLLEAKTAGSSDLVYSGDITKLSKADADLVHEAIMQMQENLKYEGELPVGTYLLDGNPFDVEKQKDVLRFKAE